MKNVALGTSSLQCTRLAYGCWRLAGTWTPKEVNSERRQAGRQAILAAFESGYTLFDHADIYCHGIAEEIFGQVLREMPEMRDRILIATKCGIRFPGEPRANSPQRYDFSKEHIIRSCEESLRRLNIETIDLYQLHRPDFLADPEEVAAAFSELQKAGKVREFGVSNFRPSLVSALQKACPMPLIVHQVEISLIRLECFADGTLDQCLENKMTPLAWSPLAGGLLGDTVKENLNTLQTARVKAIQQELAAIGQERGVSPVVVALAWLLRHPSGIIPIIGSINPVRVREAVQADSLELTREEWYRLLLASRGERLP